MKPQRSCTRFVYALALLAQLWLRPLQVAALMLLLGPTFGAGAAPGTTHPHAHVYLLRGVMNVFSLGMDEIAAKLQQQGIEASVHNHLMWSALAEEAAAEYKSGRVRTIILVGHSIGASAIASMAARLGELGVPVKLVIGLDPVTQATATGNVGLYINYYVGNGVGERVARSQKFKGTLENVDVERMPNMGHLTIDKDRALQEKVIRAIRAAL